MQTENKILMQQAKEQLQGKWGLAIGTNLVYMLITGGASSIKGIGAAISLIISGPFSLGMAIFSLSLARNEEARLEQIFDGFKDFKRALITYLIMVINIVLRLLLLIVPGIIAAFSYAMTFYILADDRSIESNIALEKSKQMMEGNKLKLFYLGLHFLGWFLLCILTLGIGFLWLFPWMNVTTAKFYEDLKDNPAAVV